MKKVPRYLFFSALNGIVVLILVISLSTRSKLRLEGLSTIPLGNAILILLGAVLCICIGLWILWRLRGENLATSWVRVRLVVVTFLIGIGVSWTLIGVNDLAHTLLGYRLF